LPATEKTSARHGTIAPVVAAAVVYIILSPRLCAAGTIDDVRFFDRALTQQEAQALFRL
jgi:hypothetical protein